MFDLPVSDPGLLLSCFVQAYFVLSNRHTNLDPDPFCLNHMQKLSRMLVPGSAEHADDLNGMPSTTDAPVMGAS